MKKLWLQPMMEDLSVKETAKSPVHEGHVDSYYFDKEGNYWDSKS